MANTRGIIMQTVPEEVAQAVDYLVDRLQLPSEIVIKAGISMMVSMHDTDDPQFRKFIDHVRFDLQRSVDRVLA